MFLKNFWNKNVAYISCISLRTRCWLSLAGNWVICILFLDFVRFAIDLLAIDKSRYFAQPRPIIVNYINNSRHLRENMLGYLSADIICSEKRTVFRERSSRKTVSYEEQIMSKDKYPSIFSPQMATIVFIILQIFFATRAVLKIGEYSRIFPVSAGEYSVTWRVKANRVQAKRFDGL